MDIRLTQSFDLRALEIGGIAGASNTNNTAAGSAYIDTGIVFHFGKRS